MREQLTSTSRPDQCRIGPILDRSPRALLVALLAVFVVCVNPSARGQVRPLPLVASHAPAPAACGAGSQKCAHELVGAGAGWTLHAFANMPMTGSAAATHAVVVIHGTGGNAAGYFASVMNAATKAGVVDHTLVIAPWFKTSTNNAGQDEAVWTHDGWKKGDAATSPTTVSSFTVLDELLTTLADRARFPNLRWITVAGHSAGAQFTQRYATFGQAPNHLPGVLVNYVIANPSSLVYFSPARPAAGGFSVPSAASCPGFNDYKYGMAHRSGYVTALTPTQAAATYTSRRVTLVTGGADTTDNGDEDTHCGAELEGVNRAERSAHYFSYIRAIAPNAPHDRVVIPGIGHDGDAIFDSPRTWPVLFGVHVQDQPRKAP